MPRLQRLKELNERRMNLALRAMASEQLIGLSKADEVRTFIDMGVYRQIVNEWGQTEKDFILCLRELSKEELQELVGARDGA